jgi:hypothetical protein
VSILSGAHVVVAAHAAPTAALGEKLINVVGGVAADAVQIPRVLPESS